MREEKDNNTFKGYRIDVRYPFVFMPEYTKTLLPDDVYGTLFY